MGTLVRDRTIRGDSRMSAGSPPTPGGGGGNDWVTLTTAQDDIDAHLLVGRLDEAGVEARTLKDRTAPGGWMYLGGSNPRAPVAVLVRRLQLEDARIVLAEISWNAPAAKQDSVAPEPTRNQVAAWWVVALALGVVFTSIAISRTADAVRACAQHSECRAPSGSTP